MAITQYNDFVGTVSAEINGKLFENKYKTLAKKLNLDKRFELIGLSFYIESEYIELICIDKNANENRKYIEIKKYIKAGELFELVAINLIAEEYKDVELNYKNCVQANFSDFH